MKRSGFKQPVLERKKAAVKPVDPKHRRNANTGPAKLTALAKTEAQRNPHLLAMAKGQPCLMQVPGICGACNPLETVAAHSNQAKHGKSMGRKADDQYSVWSCFAAHQWLDSGKGAQHREEADRAWNTAFIRQINEWTAIALHGKKSKDRAAAQWALDRLKEPQ